MKLQKNGRLLFFSRIMAAVFIFIFVILVVSNLFTKDRTFSEKENRILASKPTVSVEHISDGRFMKETETYVNDQFAFRDLWIQLKSTTDTLLGKKEANDIYLGKNKRLFEKFEISNTKNTENLKQSLLDFSKRHEKIKQYLFLAPTAVNIYSEDLPTFAPVVNQNVAMDSFLSPFASLKSIKIIDVREAFRMEKQTNLFYKTDHHWTTTGAYLAFQKAATIMGLNPTLISYEHYPVTDQFQGTLSAKSGFLGNMKEPLELYFPTTEIPYVVSYVNEQKKQASVYHSQSLKTRDKYAVFFGGNHALIEIQTASKNKGSLLVLKDSYANSFIPFLIPYYREIVVVDPRYYYNNIDTVIDDYNIKEVLFLYNANTFFTDTSLLPALQPVAQDKKQ